MFLICYLIILINPWASLSKNLDEGDKCTSTDQFLCANGNCILKNSLCDGINTCGDNSDEQICSKVCNSQQFACESAKNICIPLINKCDGKYDCQDKSDENDCDKPCSPFELTCKNGRCISKKFKCNHENDCGDNSDEVNCSYLPFNCSKNEFMCANSLCIPDKWRCDGDIDCHDNSDEIGCQNVAQRPRFSASWPPGGSSSSSSSSRSNSGTSTNKKQLGGSLDGKNSARGGLPDAWRIALLRPFNVNAYRCNEHEYQCDNGHCIMKSWRCDGDTDCLDGSDEKNCSAISCHTYEFKCKNNKCIMGILECNGADDCGDNSDEVDCAKKRKDCDPKTEFDCGDTCIPLSKVCNGKNDCGEGQDEQKSCGVNECLKSNGGCSQICTDLKIGYMCQCKPGWTLQTTNPKTGGPGDNKTCVDVNECLKPGTCSQVCVNTEGSFRCECRTNYTLSPPSKKATFCKAASGGHAKLIFANRRDIRMIDAVPLAEHSKYRLLVSELYSSVAIDFDIQTERIFWSDVSSEKIYSTPLVESKENEGYNANANIETVVEGDINMPDGISVDWVYRLIYWTDTGKNTIEVARLPDASAYTVLAANGTQIKPPSKQANATTYGGGTILARKVLIDKDLDEPRAIIVDPRHRYIYWTDWGSRPRIEKAGGNGVGRRAIVTRNIVWPNGLAIDFANDRLFWADAKLDQIISSDLEGQNRLIVIDSKQNIRHPFAITVFEDWMYWTDWENETLFSANKFTGEDLKPLARDLYSPMDVRVYHPLKQPMYHHDGTKIINVCGTYVYNGGCEQLCLPGPERKNSGKGKGQSAMYICACSTGYKIDSQDPRKCIFQNVSIITPSQGSVTVNDKTKSVQASTSGISSNSSKNSKGDSSQSGFTKVFNNKDMIGGNTRKGGASPGRSYSTVRSDDVFSRYDNYKETHQKILSSVDGSDDPTMIAGQSPAGNEPLSLRNEQKPGANKHKSNMGIVSGVFITIAISCLVIFLLWKNYSNQTVKSLNFDNPVYRKTTEDHISLDNKSIASGVDFVGNGNGGIGGSIIGGALTGLGSAFNSKLRFSPLSTSNHSNHHNSSGNNNSYQMASNSSRLPPYSSLTPNATHNNPLASPSAFGNRSSSQSSPHNNHGSNSISRNYNPLLSTTSPLALAASKLKMMPNGAGYNILGTEPGADYYPSSEARLDQPLTQYRDDDGGQDDSAPFFDDERPAPPQGS